jgi:hypothetical protein
MHDEALSPEHRAALLALAPTSRQGFYLAGGTGLCLRLAHRRSVDIDLFREAEFDPAAVLEALRAEGVAATNVRTNVNTLWFDVNGVPTSLMAFPYPSVAPPSPALGVQVASLEDIAAMKVEAIAARGARKDFIDLYFICKDGLTFAGAVSSFERRFARAHPDLAHRLKALVYFEDAEREPEPLLLRPVPWAVVRAFFESEVRALWEQGRR